MTLNFINMCIMTLSVFRWLQMIYPERLSDALNHVLMSVNTIHHVDKQKYHHTSVHGVPKVVLHSSHWCFSWKGSL